MRNQYNLSLELRKFVQGNVAWYEWYSHKLNMAGDVFKASRATPKTIEEEKQKFIAREMAYKNPRLPKNQSV